MIIYEYYKKIKYTQILIYLFNNYISYNIYISNISYDIIL